MIKECYKYCVKSYSDKVLSPYEKECYNLCLTNFYSFYVEVKNSLNSYVENWEYLKYLLQIFNKIIYNKWMDNA